jgi:sulfur-oxidizing protein SoxX
METDVNAIVTIAFDPCDAPGGRKQYACRAKMAAENAMRTSFIGLVLGMTGCLAGGAAAQPAPSPVPPGQSLAFDRSKGNCLTCHVIAGGDAPGNVGPELFDMKKRYPDRRALAAIVFDETARNPQTLMPPFGRNLILTEQEIESVVDFLYTR